MTAPLEMTEACPRRRSAFRPAVLLGMALVAPKAVYLLSTGGLAQDGLARLVGALAAISYQDLLFAAGLGIAAEIALGLTRRRPRAGTAAWGAYLFLGAVCASYAVANLRIFTYLRAPLTYPLLSLAGDMKNVKSSVGTFLTPGVLAALALAPLAFLLATLLATRRGARGPSRAGLGVALVTLVAWTACGRSVLDGPWRDRADRRISDSAHWVLVSSCAREILGEPSVVLDDHFGPEDQADFAPASERPRRAAAPPDPVVAQARERIRNVVLVVLESTGARYLDPYGSPYGATPRLRAEAASSLLFDAAYAHVGHTASSLVAITLSIYPGLSWRDLTRDHPDLPGVSLAQVLGARGYRTAFLTPGDLAWANERAFLAGRGFDVIEDYRDLGCGEPLSSWGVEDRCGFEASLRWIDAGREEKRPFFLTLWTDQTHHPYEPSPGVPPVDFFRGKALPPDDWDLGRYLNVLHETDRHLGRFLDGLRERGLAGNTLVVITGDHGEAFGEPHETWGHDFEVWQESVQVPLIVWSPALFAGGARRETVVGHIDIDPTVLDLLGIEAPGGWEGRSAFDPARPPRAYFYAARDEYLLGVREGGWKYLFNATLGRERLFDLAADPTEQADVARRHPELCERLRRRLAAWVAHERKRMERIERGEP
jgi:lipoteichoic acid synthase